MLRPNKCSRSNLHMLAEDKRQPWIVLPPQSRNQQVIASERAIALGSYAWLDVKETEEKS